MPRFGFGARGHPHGGVAAIAQSVPVLPTGFALNGSTNPALRAMLSGVRTGTRRGRIVFKGDSTTVGDGGGNAPSRIAGGRANRAPAALATRLTAAGTPALDGSCFNGNVAPTLGTPESSIPSFDPRVGMGSWIDNDAGSSGALAHEFAGSG